MGQGMAQVFQSVIGNGIEASALALLVALMTRGRRQSPALRHLLWLLVLVKLLLPPVLVDPWGLGAAWGRTAAWLRSPPRTELQGAGEVAPEPGSETGPEPERESEALLFAEEETPLSDPAGRDWAALLLSGGSALWVLGALAMAATQVARIAGFRARLRNAVPAPGEVEAACSVLAARLGLVRPPSLRILPGLSSPLVWALGRPVVVLPPELALPASRAVLQNVLAHELAHLRRRDPWVSWFELLAMCLYWWLPTLWWARRELRRSADQACDAWAVSVVGSRRSYAASLLAAIEILQEAGTPLPLGGLGLGEREDLERRLTMVMRERPSPRLSRPACLLVALTGLIALPASPLRLGAQVAKPPQEAAPPAGTGESASTPAPAKASEPAEAAEPAPASPAAGKTPALPAVRARASRSPTDTESRLESLERKMARILDELESLRSGPAVRGMAAGEAPVQIAPAKVRRIVKAAPRDGDRVSSTAPRVEAGPRTGVVVQPPPDEQGWPVYDSKQTRPAAAVNGNREYFYERSYRAGTLMGNAFRFDARRLPVSDEKRKQIEDINRKFEERMKALLDEQKKAMQALTEEHRSAIKESLKSDLSTEEIEDLDFDRTQSAPPAK